MWGLTCSSCHTSSLRVRKEHSIYGEAECIKFWQAPSCQNCIMNNNPQRRPPAQPHVLIADHSQPIAQHLEQPAGACWSLLLQCSRSQLPSAARHLASVTAVRESQLVIYTQYARAFLQGAHVSTLVCAVNIRAKWLLFKTQSQTSCFTQFEFRHLLMSCTTLFAGTDVIFLWVLIFGAAGNAG